jgi:hypothetical protein
VDAGSGKTGNTAEVRQRNADTDGGGILEAVEFYPAEAGTVRLQTGRGESEGMA